MCVDYMGLNKACPKDPFPLPCIDQVVDSTSGCKTLCFLDAYSVYHQIMMKESDQLMTSFITSFGSFCYATMLFSLKNEWSKNAVHNVICRPYRKEEVLSLLRVTFGDGHDVLPSWRGCPKLGCYGKNRKMGA